MPVVKMRTHEAIASAFLYWLSLGSSDKALTINVTPAIANNENSR
jgi:hypothetical protein